MTTPKTRPIAEGKVIKGMRILKSVLEAIDVEEVQPGKFDNASAFIQHFLTQYFEIEVPMYELLGYFSSRKKPNRSASGKRSQRCFEKRLYLVKFVMDRRLAIANWKRKSFALRKRISWKQVCAEWNKAHPHDPMTPAVLKVGYYRAIAEEGIQRAYFASKNYEYDTLWSGILRDPYNLAGSGKSLRTWHFDQGLLKQAEKEAQRLRLKSAASLINYLLVEYYRGNLITRKK
tara:strand:+ start:567 stop:1262 length:696 start_codon:yes stop_codon:yes gene_type:complete